MHAEAQQLRGLTSRAVLWLFLRKVKAAGWWQDMHTALSLHTLSARGTRHSTLSKGLRWYVESRAAMMTSLPWSAHSSA